MRLRDLWVATRAGQAGGTLPRLVTAGVDQARDRAGKARGQRFGENEAASMEEKARAWFHNHGYPFAKVQAARQVDSNQRRRHPAGRAGPAAAGRIQVTVEGLRRSATGYSARASLPFRRLVFSRGSGRRKARVSSRSTCSARHSSIWTSKQPTDTLVGVRVEVLEGGPRVTLAELGYISEGAGSQAGSSGPTRTSPVAHGA